MGSLAAMFEIGNTLREARLRRGLDIPQCEYETKIRAKYLRAMEEEQFDLMPSPTYVRGFLRTYADFLDLDGQLVLDEYESRFGGFEGGPDFDPRRGRGVRTPPGQYRRDRGRQRGRRRAEPRRTEAQLLWLAIGGVMAVALLVWLGVGNEEPAEAPIPTPPATTESSTATTGTAGVEEEVPAEPERVEITLIGTGDIGSYLEVHGKNAQGPRVFVGTLDPGQTLTYRVKRSIYVVVGNPEGLAVTVDQNSRQLTGGTGNFIVSRKGARRVDA
jgi:hypothetical protein